MTRFAFIDREKAFYDLTVLCRLLKVSRSGFYAWLRRPPSPRAVADQVLTEQIRAAYDDNRQVYGSPRIHAELADAGVRVGKKRVARLMRKAEIVGCHRRKRSFSITKQNPKAEAAPDLVDRKFIATRPNQLWVADVYVRTWCGFVYVAFAIDLYSRAIVGWSASTTKDVTFVEQCLTMALWRRDHTDRPAPPGMIHHSDAGSQYTSVRFTETLALQRLSASIGSIGDAYDNAAAETVFGLYKNEAVASGSPFPTGPLRHLADVKALTMNYVHWYNNDRLHSELAYLSPEEYEQAFYALPTGSPSGEAANKKTA